MQSMRFKEERKISFYFLVFVLLLWGLLIAHDELMSL